MSLHREYPLLGILNFAAALAGGILVFGVSFLGGTVSYIVLTLTRKSPAPLDYYETITLGTYLAYVLIVTVLICCATSRNTRLKRIGTFLVGAVAFWAIHDSLPLTPWVPLGLAAVAALPIYQILIRHARTRHTDH